MIIAQLLGLRSDQLEGETAPVVNTPRVMARNIGKVLAEGLALGESRLLQRHGPVDSAMAKFTAFGAGWSRLRPPRAVGLVRRAAQRE